MRSEYGERDSRFGGQGEQGFVFAEQQAGSAAGSEFEKFLVVRIFARGQVNRNAGVVAARQAEVALKQGVCGCFIEFQSGIGEDANQFKPGFGVYPGDKASGFKCVQDRQCGGIGKMKQIQYHVGVENAVDGLRGGGKWHGGRIIMASLLTATDHASYFACSDGRLG